MATVPVLAVLRRVGSSDEWSEARLTKLATALKDVGLTTSRELRLVFPADVGSRMHEVTGLAAELAASIGNGKADEIALLVMAAANSCMGLSMEACHAPITTGFTRPRRLLAGTYVEAEAAVDYNKPRAPVRPATSTSTPTIAQLPRGRLSFGVSSAPGPSSSTGSRKAAATISALGASLVEGAAKRPKLSLGKGSATVARRDWVVMQRARGRS